MHSACPLQEASPAGPVPALRAVLQPSEDRWQPQRGLRPALSTLRSHRLGPSLVIDGRSLAYALQKNLRTNSSSSLSSAGLSFVVAQPPAEEHGGETGQSKLKAMTLAIGKYPGRTASCAAASS